MTGGLLFALAFDHRNSLRRDFFGLSGSPTGEDEVRCRLAKTVVFEGLCRAIELGLAAGRPALLVDEQYGSDVIESAKARRVTLIVPFEVSGRDELAFEHGDDGVRDALERIGPDYAKVLIRQHPDGDRDANARQVERLVAFQSHCATAGVPWMLELLVPPPGDTERRRFDEVERPRATIRVVDHLIAAGIRPALWKLEGMPSTEAFGDVAAACTAGDPSARLLVLGRGADRQAVAAWFARAAPVPGFNGFAVGRTVWWAPLRSFFDGLTTRDETAGRIAANYLDLVATYVGSC